MIALHIAIMPAQARGQATACFYLAFDLGIGGGAWPLGFVLQWWGLTWLYLIAALIACLGSLVAQRLPVDEGRMTNDEDDVRHLSPLVFRPLSRRSDSSDRL